MGEKQIIRFLLIGSTISGGLTAFFLLEKELEQKVLIAHNFVFNSATLKSFFHFLSDYGLLLIGCFYLLLTVFLLKEKNEAEQTLTRALSLVVFCYLLAALSSDLLKPLFSRPRPVHLFSELIEAHYQSSTSSFPSGHTARSFALSIPFLISAFHESNPLKMLKIIPFILALFISYSRLALQEHFLSDISASICLVLLLTTLLVTFFSSLNFLNKIPIKGKRVLFVLIFLCLTIGFLFF